MLALLRQQFLCTFVSLVIFAAMSIEDGLSGRYVTLDARSPRKLQAGLAGDATMFSL